MVRPWIHLAQNQILLNQAKVLATVGDVARTLSKIVTLEHTSMAFLCDRLFNIFLLYNCFIESDNFSPFTTLLYIQIDNTKLSDKIIVKKINFNCMRTIIDCLLIEFTINCLFCFLCQNNCLFFYN